MRKTYVPRTFNPGLDPGLYRRRQGQDYLRPGPGPAGHRPGLPGFYGTIYEGLGHRRGPDGGRTLGPGFHPAPLRPPGPGESEEPRSRRSGPDPSGLGFGTAGAFGRGA